MNVRVFNEEVCVISDRLAHDQPVDVKLEQHRRRQLKAACFERPPHRAKTARGGWPSRATERIDCRRIFAPTCGSQRPGSPHLLAVELFLDVLNATVMQEAAGFDYTGGGSRPLVKTAQSEPIIIPSLGLKVKY